MTIEEIKTHIEQFKAVTAKWSITPANLGNLLKDILLVGEAAFDKACNIEDSLPAMVERIESLESRMNALPDNFDAFIFLDINVADSKTRFVNNENWERVWNAMQANRLHSYIALITVIPVNRRPIFKITLGIVN